jgi:hypothetical protein
VAEARSWEQTLGGTASEFPSSLPLSTGLGLLAITGVLALCSTTVIASVPRYVLSNPLLLLCSDYYSDVKPSGFIQLLPKESEPCDTCTHVSTHVCAPSCSPDCLPASGPNCAVLLLFRKACHTLCNFRTPLPLDTVLTISLFLLSWSCVYIFLISEGKPSPCSLSSPHGGWSVPDTQRVPL